MTKYSSRASNGLGWGSILLGGIIVWLLMGEGGGAVLRFIRWVALTVMALIALFAIANWDIIDSLIAGAF